MKIKMCECEWNRLYRPKGPVRIKKVRRPNPDTLVARLSGAVRAEVAVVREKGSYYFLAPTKLGGSHEVPADSLTDCLHYSVEQMGKKIRKEKKEGKR